MFAAMDHNDSCRQLRLAAGKGGVLLNLLQAAYTARSITRTAQRTQSWLIPGVDLTLDILPTPQILTRGP